MSNLREDDERDTTEHAPAVGVRPLRDKVRPWWDDPRQRAEATYAFTVKGGTPKYHK